MGEACKVDNVLIHTIHWIIALTFYSAALRWLSQGLKMPAYFYYFKFKKLNCVSRFRQIAGWDPDETLFVNVTNDEEWTRQQVEEHSNRVSNYFMQRGFKKGDTVAFFMPNRPT